VRWQRERIHKETLVEAGSFGCSEIPTVVRQAAERELAYGEEARPQADRPGR